jgi:hypothetical protein
VSTGVSRLTDDPRVVSAAGQNLSENCFKQNATSGFINLQFDRPVTIFNQADLLGCRSGNIYQPVLGIRAAVIDRDLN